MNHSAPNNKLIARNTFALYVRMLITLVVSLYVSRVVLDQLGVIDYGIYSVVGSVVSFFSFVNLSMASATTRFITFAMSKRDGNELRNTFSCAFTIHVAIALLVFLLAETVGLWFLNNKLMIPPDRMNVARIVYQISILTAMITITQVPYNAIIIANERMHVYAYVEVLRSALLVLVTYLLTISGFDKLIVYSVLYFIVVLTVLLIYRVYCRIQFQAAHLRWQTNLRRYTPMTKFLAWDLYGNGCASAHHHGVNFIINIFFGVIYNASTSIASSVNVALLQLTKAVVDAFRPQIIKQYAAGAIGLMNELMCKATRYAILLLGCMAIPCILEMPYILSLWLVKVPPYAVVFCRILLLVSLFGIINSILIIGIHATGRIKMLSLASGSIYLLTIPVVYVCYRLNYGIESSYIVMLIAIILITITNLMIEWYLVPKFALKNYLKECGLSLCFVACSGLLALCAHRSMSQSFGRLVVVVLIAVVSISLLHIIIYGYKPLLSLIHGKNYN